MAKKQSLSYGPNMGLIAGEAQVAASEAGLSNSVGAFAQGFSATYAIFQQEEDKRAAMMEAYAEEAGSIDQVNFMKDPKNKEVVRGFLNKQRDEMARLGGIYEKTKDRKVKDKMEAIKFSLVNLNDQIKVFNEDKSEYRTAFDEDQLAAGSTFDANFFTGAYTNNGSFVIAENGDMSFDVDGKNYLYKDKAGKWNPKNNITEVFFRDGYSKAIAAGEAGKSFYEETINMSMDANLKSTGIEGLQVMVTTDLTGDTRDGKQIPYSFQAQWEGGMLDDKFYKNRKKEEGSDWMFKNENSKELRGLMSTYLTDVTKDGYEIGKKNYKPEGSDGGGSGKDKKTQTELARADGWTGLYVYTEPSDGEVGPQKIDWRVAVRRRNQLNILGDISGQHDSYKWNADLNPPSYENSKGKAMSLYEVAKDEGLVRNGEGKGDFNFKKIAKKNEDNEYLGKNEAPPSFLKDYGDSDASSKLNKQFNLVQGTVGGKYLDGDTDYYFVPWSSQSKKNGEYLLSGGDNVLTNDIMLVDITSGKAMPVLNEEGSIRRFGTGEDFKQDDLDFINNLLKSYANKKEKDPLDNN